jgi:hypothetical protein
MLEAVTAADVAEDPLVAADFPLTLIQQIECDPCALAVALHSPTFSEMETEAYRFQPQH